MCTSLQRSTRPFTVLHSNGIHLVDIWFCGCNLAVHHGDHVQQLLRHCIFPSTTTDPQTGSTFTLLELSHILSFQSKLSLYDLYISIETLTDATHVTDIKVRSHCHHPSHPSPMRLKDQYQAFLWMLWIWRHLHLLKQGGRAHDLGGAGGTRAREHAVLCPACPYPDINLPADWKSVGKGLKFV